MPTLHTASFYAPQHWLGRPFRVSRLHPRGRKTRWESLPFFYPPAELLKGYRDGQQDFQSFSRSYLAVLNEHWAGDTDMQRWMGALHLLDQLTLLCFEREGEPCHRRVLAQWLKDKAPFLELGALR